MAWRHNQYKRQIGKSILYLKDVESFLALFCQLCNPDHPELIEWVCHIGAGLTLAREQLQDLWTECWGHLPEELQGGIASDLT